MDFQQLQYFEALCETLNYTTAARQCFISRQGLRQAVSSLEAECGVKLIENNHNHLSLTPAGQVFAHHAAKTLNAYRELNKAMRSQITADQPLRIGISRSLVPFFAPELVERAEYFPADYPSLPVQLDMYSTDDILARMQDGTLDAGLVVDMPGSPSPYKRIELFRDTLVILLASAHPLAAKQALTLDDLAGQTLLVMSEPRQCFYELTNALSQRQIPVSYQIAPDYYEAGYRILNTDSLAIDRCCGESMPRRGRLDSDLALENGQYMLTCSLLIADTAPLEMRYFTEYMAKKS